MNKNSFQGVGIELDFLHGYKELQKVNFTECKLRIDTSDSLEAAQSNYANKIISWNGALKIFYKVLQTVYPTSSINSHPWFLLI